MQSKHPLALACLLVAAGVHAQGSGGPQISLYGSIDIGLTFIDNVRGSALTRADSGSLYANRLGLRGQEDLGGGLNALFVLESGFNADDGSWGQGGLGFGRQSYVGLRNAWGTLTLGRQYDFLYAGSPLPLDIGALLLGGLAGATGGAGTSVDNHSGGTRYDNTIKWQGRHGAWSGGAMYGAGNESGTQRMRSLVVSYRQSDVWAGVGHTRDNLSAPAGGNAVTVASLNWTIKPQHKLIATVSDARADRTSDTHSRNRMLQLGWLHDVTPLWLVGVAYGQSKTLNAARAPGDIQQWGLGTQYLLSKRTTLYAMGSRVTASGSAGTAYSGVPGVGTPAASMRSSDGQQWVFKTGVLHRF